MSPGSSESGTSEFAIVMTPPFSSEGLSTEVTAALNSDVPPPPLPLPSPSSDEPPPQAARINTVVAVAATAPQLRCLFILLRLSVVELSFRMELVGRTCLAATTRSSSTGIEGIAQAVSEEVEGQHGDEDRDTGDQHEHRVRLVVG